MKQILTALALLLAAFALPGAASAATATPAAGLAPEAFAAATPAQYGGGGGYHGRDGDDGDDGYGDDRHYDDGYRERRRYRHHRYSDRRAFCWDCLRRCRDDWCPRRCWGWQRWCPAFREY
jgi:hypothetical protein